jgi:DNA-binding CsgD family transcriptional regulator
LSAVGENWFGVPRPSLYSIELSVEEERELRQRAARYTLPYREVQRAKLVLMAAAGLENGEIARRLEVRVDTVRIWRKRFFEERLAGLEEAPGRGRRAVFRSSCRSRGSCGVWEVWSVAAEFEHGECDHGVGGVEAVGASDDES